MDSHSKNVDIRFDASFQSKFPIGGPVLIEHAGKRYTSILKGVLFSKFVLMDVPVFQGRPVVFDYSAVLIVRFIVAGVVYGFKTVVLRMHKKPLVLVLEYPTKITQNNLRESGRIKILLPIRVSMNGCSEITDGAILDLSSKGALVTMKTSMEIKKKQKILVSMTLPDGRKIESMVCYICNIRFLGDKKIFGVSFEDRDEGSSKLIKSFYNDCYQIYSSHKSNSEEDESVKSGMFSIGQEMTIEVQGKGIKTLLQGWHQWRDEGYFLIYPPSMHDIGQAPKPGSNIIVRYMSGGTVYGTATRFAVSLAKTNLWMLEFSGDVEELSLRSNERFYCLIPVRLTGSEKGKIEEIGTGLICDISFSGAKIITKEPISLPESNMIQISILLSDAGAIEFQECEVVRKTVQIGYIEYAGMFVDMNEENKEKLQKFFEFCKTWIME